MYIKSIVAGAAIALIAGVGSVSADELSVADTTGDAGTPFAMLDGIATEQMSEQELAGTRGLGGATDGIPDIITGAGPGGLGVVERPGYPLLQPLSTR